MRVGKHNKRRLPGLMLAACVLGVLGGAFGSSGTANADPVGLAALGAGSCIDGYVPGNGVPRMFNLVPCMMPHDVEVVAKFTPGGKWPGDDGSHGLARALCRPAIAASVGGTLIPLRTGWLLPANEVTWRHDSTIVCIVTPANGGKLFGGYVGQPRIPTGSAM